MTEDQIRSAFNEGYPSGKFVAAILVPFSEGGGTTVDIYYLGERGERRRAACGTTKSRSMAMAAKMIGEHALRHKDSDDPTTWANDKSKYSRDQILGDFEAIQTPL